MEYRREIDGLRGIAVLSVLAFHLGIEAFSGGFVGVDIFFVISGYLITRIIYDEVSETGSFSFSSFYIRRVRRLFPALVFTLTLTFIAGFFLFATKFFEGFSRSLISALVSLSNFYFWKTSDYFAPAAEFEPLLHTWSLSVEEQFYLLWPITLVLLIKKYQKSVAILFLVLVSIASLLLNQLYKENSELIFYLLPFRVFEFGIGALLVWLIRYQPSDKRWLEVLAVIGLVMIAFSVYSFTKFTVFPYFNALLPCVGAALLIYAGHTKYVGNILGNRALIGVGLISYSLYLIHWPIIAFYKYYKDIDSLNLVEVMIITSISLVLAYLMYRFVEQPFRRVSKGQQNNRRFLLHGIVVSSVIAFFAAYVIVDSGAAWRIESIRNYQNVSYGGEDYSWETYVGNPDSPKKLILYGDSHAKQYLGALEKLAINNNIRIQYIGHSACISLPEVTNIYKGKIRQSCIDLLDKLRMAAKDNDLPIILAYRYTKTITDPRNISPVSHTEESRYVEKLFKGFEKLHEVLGKDRTLIVIGGVPSANLKKGYLDCISRPFTSIKCHDKYPIQKAEFSNLRFEFEKYESKNENILFLDPYLALCDESDCYVAEDSVLYYSDHAHLTADGADKVINQFSNQIMSTVGIGN